MLHHFQAKDSSNSPVVRHLLASWEPAWQPTLLPHTLARKSHKKKVNFNLKCYDNAFGNHFVELFHRMVNVSISMNVKQKTLNATNMRNVSTNRDISTVNANMMRVTMEMERIVTVSVFFPCFISSASFTCIVKIPIFAPFKNGFSAVAW